uniref:Thymopoietin a n=1 Tax=Amphiprion ocellaris TaxID=80972 RepID=A0AAQ5Y420_AMPOC
MPEYLDDPSVLTKDKLKSELLAHNVELPSGNHNKDVYVQLYLKNLTAQNQKHVTATTLDAFSSDEELPPPVVSSRSRSSGRKATRKTDKVQLDELDVTVLTDESLRDELIKHGMDVGPVVASTRKLYEKKLQKLLDDGPAPLPLPQLVLTDIQVNHNGNSESDLYSDKEDEVMEAPVPEPVAEPQPAPVVERPVRSRGKTPVTTRTHSSQHQTLQEEQLPQHLPKHDKDTSHKAASQLNTAQLKEPKPSAEAAVGQRQKATTVRPADRSKGLTGVQSPRQAVKPSRPSSFLVHLTKANQISFSPICDISPTETEKSDQCGSTLGSRSTEECVPPDVLLPHRHRQQKITSFLSTCSPVRTMDCVSALSKDVLVRQVEKIAASDQTPRVEEKDVLKQLFSNDINSPTGITATCRRPIRGAAGRPVVSSDLWNDENIILSPKTKTSNYSYTETHTVNRVPTLPPSSASSSSSSSSSSSFIPSASSSSSRLLSAAPPAGQTKAVRRSVSLWIKLFLLAIVAAFLFLVYQAMETNSINPFASPGTEMAAGSAA